jgi:hypothetical protein
VRSIILTILVTLVLGVLALRCDAGRARENLQFRAVSSLSERFESVLYSKPEFVSSWDANNPLPKDRAIQLRYPFAYLWLALDSLATGAGSDLLASTEAVLMGAKDFRPPEWLGGVRSRRCYVLVLKNGNSFSMQKYTPSPATVSATGLQIWNWSSKLEEFGEGVPPDSGVRERPSMLYATEIERSYVLVSNDVNELENLARRLTSTNVESQHPVGSNDWAELLRHEMWGYRRYRLGDANNKMAAGIEDVPPNAEALMFFVDAKKSTIALRLVLKDRTDVSSVAKLYSKHRMPAPTSSRGGAWETEIPLSDDDESFGRTFSINILFGFGVYT